MNLQEARKIAIENCYKLQPYCKNGYIHIAGGIRRKKTDPHDIEIICLPKSDEVKDLFGDITCLIRSNLFCHTAENLGEAIKGKATGKMMQIKLPEDAMLDLFMPDDFDYYRQYVIRTGSADWVMRNIASSWKKIGWCGSDKGLRKISDCIEMKGVDGKSKWKCLNSKAEKPPVWESEKSFFDWLKIPYLEPEKRI